MITTDPFAGCGQTLDRKRWNRRGQRSQKRQRKEGRSTISRETYLNADRRVEINKKDVAEVIRRQLPIATGKAESVPVSNRIVLPGFAAIRAPAMKGRTTFEVRNARHQQRVGVTDGECGLGFVSTPNTHINVFGRASARLRERSGGGIFGQGRQSS